MFVVLVVVTILLSLVLVASAFGKLTKAPQVVENLDRAKVPHPWYPGLAALEVAGAVGLLVGLGVAGLGIAAAIGVIGYFVGALIFHFRAGDRAVAPPLVLMLVAVVVLFLRIATA